MIDPPLPTDVPPDLVFVFGFCGVVMTREDSLLALRKGGFPLISADDTVVWCRLTDDTRARLRRVKAADDALRDAALSA